MPAIFLEFIVQGRPLSQQSKNRAKLNEWKNKVAQAAKAKWPNNPLDTHLELTVTFYHEGSDVVLDNDNMIKPIADAMNKIIYADDGCITDHQLRKSSIDGPIVARRVSLVLLEGFSIGNEFIHVVIREAPDHRYPLG
jgi:crossover junction endodeoxyribonuclease RusA